MEFTIKAAQFLLSLSLLIILHELGHFIPAKIFKTKVEKFYLFFDYRFSLFKKKVGETVYGIGWIPLGGYVKIAGMIDESMDTDQMKEEPKPWEFRSKPAWQRLIIMVGGVTVNVILAILIYIGMFMYYGEAYLPVENIKSGLLVNEKGQAIGLETGDLVTHVDGKKIVRFSEINMELVLGESNITVLRDGETLNLPIDAEQKKGLLDGEESIVSLRVPFIIGAFSEESAGRDAGLMENDTLVSVNGELLNYHDEISPRIKALAGDSLTLGLRRDGSYAEVSMVVPDSGVVGIYALGRSSILDFYDVEFQQYSFAEAVPAGFEKTGTVLKNYIRQLKLIFNPETEAYKKVGGFIAIGSQFEPTWEWERFWSFTAFLSIMLAFLNILPIPALDGGHVVFVLIEMITGRKPSDKVLEYAQMVGFFILLALIILANGNDVLNLFKD
jgi:regulator of sigma E protease